MQALYSLTFDRTADGQIITLPHRIESRIQCVHLVVSLVFGQSVSGFGSALDFDKFLFWLVQKKYMLKSSAEKIRHILFSYLFCRVEGKATNHENVAAG